MKFRALLEFDDPGALDGHLDACQRGFSRPRCWLCAFERIELSAMAWALHLLGTLVIGDAASLVGADCRIGEDAGLGAKENGRDSLLGGGEAMGCANFELGSFDDVRGCS